MDSTLRYLYEQPILLLFILVGVGMALGRVKIRGVSLGAAFVLFAGIGATALAVSHGVTITSLNKSFFPGMETLGNVGLALFTYTIGVISGPGFFAGLKRNVGPILATVGALVVAGGAAMGIGKLLGLDWGSIAGTYAGALTNTPALAAADAASGTSNPTIAYAVSYIFGTVGFILAAAFVLRTANKDTDAPPALMSMTVRVDTHDEPRVGFLEKKYENKVTFSRVEHGEENPIVVAGEEDRLRFNDLVTLVGPEEFVQDLMEKLGHESSHHLETDRRFTDLRRITLSNGLLSGRTIAELGLEAKYGATVTRVRRGDVDMIPSFDLRVQLGDRIRVIAPTKNMKKVSQYLGDSARGQSDINPVGLGLGMAIGVGIGLIPIEVGGKTPLTLGMAAGTLIVGLIMGRLGRIGKTVTAMPHAAATALSDLGLLIFLAYAGTKAGSQIAKAFTGGTVTKILILGVVITSVAAILLVISMKLFFKMGSTTLSGLVSAADTQPAVLAYANRRTGNDNRVAMGWAIAYVVAMVVKILVAQFIGGL